MLDNDGDGIYEISVALAEDTVEYKFTVDGWTDQEQFVGGESCTSTIDGFTNRSLIVAGEPFSMWSAGTVATPVQAELLDARTQNSSNTTLMRPRMMEVVPQSLCLAHL